LADLANGDEPLTYAQAARERCLRRNGRGPHVSQIYRWATAGVDGVVLESARTGGRGRVTTRPAIFRFIARLNRGANLDIAQQPAHADRQHRAAEVALAAEGI
jgi:hypothetical protein